MDVDVIHISDTNHLMCDKLAHAHLAINCSEMALLEIRLEKTLVISELIGFMI